jgi:tetratricopeptide (TPR) repeat protein
MLSPKTAVQIRARRTMPPALIISCAVSVYATGLFLFCLALAIGAALDMSWFLLANNLLLVGLVFWAFTGVVFETFLVFRLIVLMRKHNYFAAERLYVTLIKIWRALPVRKGGRLGLAYSNLGLTRLLQGKFDAAELPLRESLLWLERDRRLRNHYSVAIAINNLAVVLVNAGELEEAEKLAKRALAIHQDKTKSTSGAAFPLITLAAIYLRQERQELAQQHLEKAQFLLDYNKKPFLILDDSIEYARVACSLNFALLRCGQGRIAEAREHCEELLDARRSQCLRSSSLETIAKVAKLLVENNEPDLAERLLERGYEIGSGHPDHQHTTALLDTYADLLTSTGRTNEISDLRRWIRPLMLTVHK